ncbi:hypothetical protein [Bacillus sp. Marseille-Q1617]|uniref:hypothetical protein n=1 Tax=Bacillus sp. Marseille-Q1617 TaxID=2736887 RepID=UPI001589DCB6|nr:hypothetical protein [Bacillus sp. Marseille-Q1617]
MNYYVNVGFTIVLLIALTAGAFAIDFIGKSLQRLIHPKFLKGTIIFIILLLMTGGSYTLSMLGEWSFIDTIFVTSLCFFGLGWITNITNRASKNAAGTTAKFITNNAYKHQYEAAGTYGISLYFLSSLIFLAGSWTVAFAVAFI